MSTRHYIQLCRDCATQVYGTRSPTPAYGDAVANLLIGTAATESHFVYRRQMAFTLNDERGAWGIWQTESASLNEGITYLKKRPNVAARAGGFLFGVLGNAKLDGIFSMGNHGLLRLVHDWDRFAVLMARIHYYRFPEAIPADLRGQAEYWKRRYNTTAGKGTPDKYITDWRRLVEPHL